MSLLKSIRTYSKKALRKVLAPYNFVQLTRPEKALILSARETEEEERRQAAELAAAAAEAEARDEQEWPDCVALFEGFDRDHVWAFNAGNSGRDFRGNPKYLFAYINNYRPDIRAYWLCPDEDTIELVRSLGFPAILSNTPEAEYAIERTGVAVAEQSKSLFPFRNAKYLNLWHGMGFKKTERTRTLDTDDMRLGLAIKYIKNHSLYMNQMLLAVTCPMQENQFYKDFALPCSQMLRIGYARCTYQSRYKPIVTFGHDIVSANSLPSDTKIVVYAPTFRIQRGNTFVDAMTDLDALYRCCERNHILMVFKMHPEMQNEAGFLAAKSVFEDHPYFMFWDNQNDIYEIMDKVDLLIYDYSSIFSDFLIAGVKKYIRYIFDSDRMVIDGYFESVDEYYDRTAGTICHTFDELLDALDHADENCDPAVLEDIYQKQWTYAGDDDFEKTIQAVMDFEIRHEVYPTLYSFDIFDTLISRKGLAPSSIFYAVRERMIAAGGFSTTLQADFPKLRHTAELNCREYMRKSQDQRDSFHVEITLRQIYDRLRDVYGLTEAQTEQLMQWEIEEELAAVIPLPEQIEIVKELKAKNETVVLISDMYLPKTVIQQMLAKADPMLAELPLFLSNEYGVLKTSRLLFFEVYRSFKPYYNFGQWIHCGDNVNADQTQPRKMNITTRRIKKPGFSEIETELTKTLNNTDAFLVAAMQARLRSEKRFAKADFVIDFVALTMVPYVDWALRDALDKGFQTLYFVSRDGHPLKRIADALIQAHNWPLKTKYIYSSRRAWRIPSYIDEIDVDFWSNQGGNFNDIESAEKLLRALDIDDEETFRRLLPQIDLDGIDFADWSDGQPARKLVPVIRASDAYREYLLERAAQKRELVCGYLKQEIDPNERFAFVEFWGRGYNQTCHSRLWNYTIGREEPLHYYYVRTVHPTEGNCVRYNMTTDNVELLFIEAIFANMPYRSVESYERRNGRIEPVIKPIFCDPDLFNAMEELLPEFARRYAALELHDPVDTDRRLFDFTLDYFNDNKDQPFIYNNIGSLMDAVSMYARKKEYARAYTMEDLERFQEHTPRGRGTRSITMSYMRSTPEFKLQYDELFQREPGSNPAGGKLLNPAQLEKNRMYREKYTKDAQRAAEAAKLYDEACTVSPIEDLIVIVSSAALPGSDAARELLRALEGQHAYRVEHISAKRKSSEDGDMMALLARARFVIADGGIVQLSGLELRPQTTYISLSSSPFKLYYYGYALTHQLDWFRKYTIFRQDNRFTDTELPGRLSGDLLFRSDNANAKALSALRGACISDVYFDEQFREEARRKLRELIPDLGDRKVIAYIPMARLKSARSRWLELLSMERLSQLIGDEYMVLVDMRNEKELVQLARNPIEIRGFSMLVPQAAISLRGLLSAADVIVGDYRDTFYESVLLDKPVFSTAFDLEKMQRSANMAYDLARINPFPIVNTAEELAEGLRNLDRYDYAPHRRFREDYLTWCDGRSSERLVQYLLETGKNAHELNSDPNN